MNLQGTMGAFIPLWIIGAPLLAGIFLLFTTPKPSPRSARDDDLGRGQDWRDRQATADRSVPTPSLAATRG